MLLLFNAGLPPIITVGEPVAQGAVHAGTHGMGVSTPEAAAVADATVGFDMELHIPKVIGNLGISIIVAAIRLEQRTVVCEVTSSGAANVPKVH